MSITLTAPRKGQLRNLWLSERWMLFVGGYIDLSSCLIMKTPGGRIIYAAAVPSDPLVDRQAIILKTSAICNRVIIPFARWASDEFDESDGFKLEPTTIYNIYKGRPDRFIPHPRQNLMEILFFFAYSGDACALFIVERIVLGSNVQAVISLFL